MIAVVTCPSCFGVHEKNQICPYCNYGTIYTFRMALRLTQEDLGKKIGKSTRTIQRYESGVTPTPTLVYNAVKQLFDDKVAEGNNRCPSEK